MITGSLLLVSPASDAALDRAAASGADALVIDVAGADAPALRRTAAFLARPGTVYLRLGSLLAADTIVLLDALVPARPAGVMLAGAEGGADVTRLAALLRPREAVAGIADGATKIIALTDTPATLLQLATYRDASPRLAALAWDDRPLAAALSADDVTAVAHAARTGTLLAAAAAGVAALDRPLPGGDPATLAGEAEAARRAGFAGKLALAAEDVAVINRVFSRPAATSS